MVKVGMLIADRYEIIEKIGTGGMSDVYRAKCHKLNRYVAVKVLKQEFSENTDFVSKFHVEAQAAAGLMHPNIVNVYDVGGESGFHYIVMELVEGITLKKYIEKKARLSVKEAVSIAIQVAMGIEAAHNNHIIHRDIKPQNIIISKEGKVKVTDFGIAKAATSNTITSNVMGSVHYTSPEQVRGGFSDEKSDVYSLGITLFEMLTGRVPFNGETTVAVAIKHIQEPMPSPREFVPEIPISVEQIVMKCTQKSPDRRYQSAPELIEDLKKSLISPNENFVKLDPGDAYGETKNFTPNDIRQIKQQAHKHDMNDARVANIGEVGEKNETVRNNTGRVNRRTTPEEALPPVEEEFMEEPEIILKKRNSSQKNPSKKTSENSKGKNAKNSNTRKNANTGKNAAKNSNTNRNSKNTSAKNADKSSARKSPDRKKGDKYEDDYDPKMELLTTILIVIAAVIVGCIFLYIVAKAVGLIGTDSVGETEQPRTQVEMIAVEGQSADNATNSLKAMGLLTAIEYQESATVEQNIVISASVEAGTMIDTGTTITLNVSSGADGAIVPEVTGKSRAEATAALESEGFIVKVTKENSDTVPKDNVIRQDPAGNTTSARGVTVNLVVSLGAEEVEVTVPSVLGETEEDAIVILAENGLTGIMVLQEYSDTVESGHVTYQNYSAGVTVNSGTEVEFRVSMGPEQCYYNCSTSVAAPPNYAGGDATVVLKGRDGTQLFSTTTSTFPVDINVSNIFAMSSGEIYISYNVNQEQTVTDAAGNTTVQTIQVPTTSGPTEVTFVKVL